MSSWSFSSFFHVLKTWFLDFDCQNIENHHHQYSENYKGKKMIIQSLFLHKGMIVKLVIIASANVILIIRWSFIIFFRKKYMHKSRFRNKLTLTSHQEAARLFVKCLISKVLELRKFINYSKNLPKKSKIIKKICPIM